VRIPGDGDQRSEPMAITVPRPCRSRFRADGDHCSDGKPITFEALPGKVIGILGIDF
jgi:hypothetical protein